MMQDDRLGVMVLAAADGADPLAGLPEPADATGLLLAERLAPDLSRVRADRRWALVRSWPSSTAAALHGAGCTCCEARAPLALLLADMFQQRARGQLPFFRRLVLVTAADEVAATRGMLLGDRLVAGRYRVLIPPETPP